jgi:Zn-dependent protease
MMSPEPSRDHRPPGVPDNTIQQLDFPPHDEAVSFAPSSEIVQAEFADGPPPRLARPRRRIVLPLVLFLLTCVSTFFAGVTGWRPLEYAIAGAASSTGMEADPYFMLPVRRAVLTNWQDGLIYMGFVLAILLTHEMGHFVMTVIYRVRASLPYFIPFPISPIGTMGAVIGMDGLRANRRQIFDIGLAGPLAGLVVAIPIMWIGARQLELKDAEPSSNVLDLPLAMQLAVDHFHPGEYNPRVGVPMDRVNPYVMAGWVGLIITGLNMMPVSQLDGGHVLYALFGRASRWLARGFMLLVFVYMGAMLILYGTPPTFILMAVLVLLIGTDHPPTSDDTVPLGWFRILLGTASLLIPIFCFVPNLRL